MSNTFLKRVPRHFWTL